MTRYVLCLFNQKKKSWRCHCINMDINIEETNGLTIGAVFCSLHSKLIRWTTRVTVPPALKVLFLLHIRASCPIITTGVFVLVCGSGAFDSSYQSSSDSQKIFLHLFFPPHTHTETHTIPSGRIFRKKEIWLPASSLIQQLSLVTSC